jgi:hypothetical protein
MKNLILPVLPVFLGLFCSKEAIEVKKLKLSQLLLIVGLIASPAMASAQSWMAVGSTGTVDDADIPIFDTVATVVQVKSTAPLPSSVDIRYNVVAIDGLLSSTNGVRMWARFRDNGTGARVLVRLFEVPFGTGIPALKLTLNSTSSAAAPDFQVSSEDGCSVRFDFFNNAYYVDVTLTKSGATGNPGLQMIKLETLTC